MYTLKGSGEARFWVLNLSALLLAGLLGLTVGVRFEGLLWLLMMRPLVAAALTLLPPTSAGDLRPYTVSLSLLSLGVVLLAGPESSSATVMLLVMFWLIDPALDTLLVARCPEPEWLGRIAQMALARSAGLALGALGSALLADQGPTLRPAVAAMLGVLVFLLAVPEAPERSAWVPRRLGSEGRSATLLESLGQLRQPALAGRILALFAAALLAGTLWPLLLPLPLVTPDLLDDWLLRSTVWWGLALLTAVLALLLERLHRPAIITLCYSLLLTGLVASVLVKAEVPELTLTLAVLANLAALLACRQALTTGIGMAPCPRATLPLWVWALGLLTGQSLRTAPSTACQIAMALASLGLLVALLGELLGWYRGGAHSHKGPTIVETSPGKSVRHGDLKQDFTAAPVPLTRRPSAMRWLARLWFVLVVRFPVTLSLAVLAGFLLAGAWHISDHRKTWHQRTHEAWIRCQTELFLTSLKHRLEEEMLASNRVPTNWEEFVANNFQLDGRALKDRDFWGTPLYFDVQSDHVLIVSAGPDKKLNTADDLARSAHRPSGVR